MRIKAIQKEIIELLLFINEYCLEDDEIDNTSIINKIYDIAYKYE